MTVKLSHITEQHKAAFLKLIREGKNRSQAAHLLDPDGTLGFTGTKFRALTGIDPDFAAQYEQAAEENREAHRERVIAEFERRALDPEAKSDRLLYLERLNVDPDFHRAVTTSRQQIEHTGKDGGPIELTSTERVELVARLATLAELRDETNGPPALTRGAAGSLPGSE